MAQKEEQGNGFGITAFVLSILGILFSFAWGFGLIFAILALIFSLIQRNRNQNGLNIAGFVMSLVGIVLSLLMILVLVLLFAYITPSLVTTTMQEGSVQMNPPFSIQNYRINTLSESVFIALQNDGGQDLTVNSISFSGSSENDNSYCHQEMNQKINAGAFHNFYLSDGNCNFNPQEYYYGDIEVRYTPEGATTELVATGLIQTTA